MIVVMTAHKRCPLCQELKAHNDFYEINSTARGLVLSSRCKACIRESQRSRRTCVRCESVYMPGKRGSHLLCTDCDAVVSRCPRCQSFKPKDQFYTGKKSSYCKPCQRVASQRYRYGLTEAEMDLLEKTCAICGSEESLSIDHCHTSGAVRNTLCRQCNSGLGMFKDDPALLRQALAYLDSHQPPPR